MKSGRRKGAKTLLLSAVLASLLCSCSGDGEEASEVGSPEEGTAEEGTAEEGAEEGAAEAEGDDEEGAAEAEGDDAGPDPSRTPVAGEGNERGRILGEIEVDGFLGGLIHIDAVVEEEGENVVVAKATFERPGPYRLVVKGDHSEVNLVVYLDLDGDGPTAGDKRFDYPGNPVSLELGERIEGLNIVVDDTGEGIAGEHDPDDNSPPDAPVGSAQPDGEESTDAPPSEEVPAEEGAED